MKHTIRLCCFADEISPDIHEQIRVMKKHGISLCEVRSVNGKNVAEWEESEAKEYAGIFRENGITVWSLGSPLGKSDIGEDFSVYKARCEKLLRIAALLSTDRIRVFSFFHAYRAADEVIRRLKWAVHAAEERGILLCHENEKEIFGDTVERVSYLHNHIDGLGMILDPANFIQVGENAESFIAALSDKAEYYHIKDALCKTGEVVPAGYGDGRIAEMLRSCRGEKVLTLEPHLALFEGYAVLDNTEMKNKFLFSSREEAFDKAVESLEKILTDEGYIKTEGEETTWIK